MKLFSFFKTSFIGLFGILFFIGCQPSSISLSVPISEAIAVSPKQVELAGTEGSATIVINSSVNWNVECSASWLSSSILMGTPNDKQLIISAKENTSDASRLATITIKSPDCDGTIEISVIQNSQNSSHPLSQLFGKYVARDATNYFGETEDYAIIISDCPGSESNVSIELLFPGNITTGNVNLSQRTITFSGEIKMEENVDWIYWYCAIQSIVNELITFDSQTSISFDSGYTKLIVPPFGIYAENKKNDDNSGWYTIFNSNVVFYKE